MHNTSAKLAAKFDGWRMVALASLCVNIGVGFTFGAYGTFMPSIIAEFSASHSLASGGLSLLVAMAGLCAPVASYAVGRWSIRVTVTAGCVFMSAGWGLVSVAANPWQFILGFGISCGAATACLVGVPPMTLINNWFIALRGRALGISTVAILLMIVPSLAAVGITTFGWRATALTISAISLLLSPLMLLVVDNPESVGQSALGATYFGGRNRDLEKKIVTVDHGCDPFSDPVFWTLLLCGGLCGALSVALIAHLVPFALWRGLSLETAASLVSILGGAALVDGLLSGVIVDRIGGARTFAFVAFAQSIAWPCLLLPVGYYLSAACVAVIGLSGSSMQPAMMTLIINVFGRERFSRVLGLLAACTTPLSIILPLIAGVLYDLSGSYRQVFLIYAALYGVVGTAFCFVSRIEAHRQSTVGATAVVLGS